MKKVLLIAVVLLSLAAQSCRQDDLTEFEIDSPDKDKQECTGCDNGDD